MFHVGWKSRAFKKISLNVVSPRADSLLVQIAPSHKQPIHGDAGDQIPLRSPSCPSIEGFVFCGHAVGSFHLSASAGAIFDRQVQAELTRGLLHPVCLQPAGPGC